MSAAELEVIVHFGPRLQVIKRGAQELYRYCEGRSGMRGAAHEFPVGGFLPAAVKREINYHAAKSRRKKASRSLTG